jgi:DNA-binding NtrC family response regulator
MLVESGAPWHGSKVPWIAVFMQFDGERWIEMLEQGAFDVVCAPFQPEAVQAVIQRADSKARSKNDGDSNAEKDPATIER